jgi:hypothetical protein
LFKSNQIVLWVLGLVLILFAGAVGRLFFLRFEAGDIYPHYSTLRSDPLGTRVFYEGLKALRPGSVRRNYDALSRMDPPQGSSLFFLGVRSRGFGRMSEKSAKILERVMLNGGSLIIAFRAQGPRSTPKGRKQGGQKKGGGPVSVDQGEASGKKGPAGQDREPGTSGPRDEKKKTAGKGPEGVGQPGVGTSLQKRWGFRLERTRTRAHLRKALRVSEPVSQNLPQTVPWHSSLVFGKLQGPWHPVYTRGGRPVVLERSFGRGRLVLSSDSYLFSNEALSRDRYPELLSWFAGNGRQLIFDETHLGSSRSPGIASLVRSYGLHWMALGLLLVAALFIWKNAAHFVPPRDRMDGTASQIQGTGRDATGGLISLLRRSISEKDLMGICYREWAGPLMSGKGRHVEKTKQVKAELDRYALDAGRKSDPVGAYRAVCRMLSRRRNT